MSRGLASIQSTTFVYDFAIDGGAIGTINMGTFIPQNAELMMFGIDIVSNITANFNCTMAFGLVGRPNAFKGATLIPTLNGGIFQVCNEAITKLAAGLQTMITIGTATVTGGSLKCTVTFVTN